jgi:uncharacterized protein YukJ
MPLSSYGVLSGQVVDARREDGSDSPHYQIHLVDTAGVHFRVAVNVESAQAPSELLYLVDEDFRHPLTASLPDAGAGWTPLPSKPGAANLDFIRANLFDPAAMRLLPPDAIGPDNDLADLLDHYVLRAKNDPRSAVYVFGERWPSEPGTRDKVFGFLPGNGVHDVHMNQGNSSRFVRDDGVWQDGGLLLRIDDRWVAIFLAFQSQSFHTDDVTGHALTDVEPRPDTTRTEPARVIAALANPAGGAPETETVTLINASADPLDLTGWRILDRAKTGCPIGDGKLGAGAVLVVTPTDGFTLGNNGGAITLLDARGLKVHGVAYTAEQSHAEGWTITF